MSDCQKDMMKAGGAYPRTCPRCKLGPCQKYAPEKVWIVSAEGGPMAEFITENDAKEAMWEFAKSWPTVSLRVR